MECLLSVNNTLKEHQGSELAAKEIQKNSKKESGLVQIKTITLAIPGCTLHFFKFISEMLFNNRTMLQDSDIPF